MLWAPGDALRTNYLEREMRRIIGIINNALLTNYKDFEAAESEGGAPRKCRSDKSFFMAPLCSSPRDCRSWSRNTWSMSAQ